MKQKLSKKMLKKKIGKLLRTFVKRYKRELIVLLVQILLFYILPLFAGPTDMMGVIVLLLVSSFVLGIVVGYISKDRMKFAYPVAVGMVFLPSVLIYYNSTATIHSVWYFMISDVGLLFGMILKYIISNNKSA